MQSSSFTGPAGEDLGHLQPVEEEPDMRGADNYSISVIRTGGTHGDTFQCMASNGDSTGTANSVLSGTSYIDILDFYHYYIYPVNNASSFSCIPYDKYTTLQRHMKIHIGIVCYCSVDQSCRDFSTANNT